MEISVPVKDDYGLDYVHDCCFGYEWLDSGLDLSAVFHLNDFDPAANEIGSIAFRDLSLEHGPWSLSEKQAFWVDFQTISSFVSIFRRRYPNWKIN